MKIHSSPFRRLLCALSLLIIVASTNSIFASAALAAPIYTGLFSDKAVSGYDAVSYFTESKAVPGKKEFSTKYMNTTWLFTSQAHLDLFKENPEKYAPQYGGYCAYAAGANNDLVSADPEAWKIINGKLYLNYNKDIQNTWEKNQSHYIELADKNWPELSKK